MMSRKAFYAVVSTLTRPVNINQLYLKWNSQYNDLVLLWEFAKKGNNVFFLRANHNESLHTLRPNNLEKLGLLNVSCFCCISLPMRRSSSSSAANCLAAGEDGEWKLNESVYSFRNILNFRERGSVPPVRLPRSLGHSMWYPRSYLLITNPCPESKTNKKRNWKKAVFANDKFVNASEINLFFVLPSKCDISLVFRVCFRLWPLVKLLKNEECLFCNIIKQIQSNKPFSWQQRHPGQKRGKGWESNAFQSVWSNKMRNSAFKAS